MDKTKLLEILQPMAGREIAVLGRIVRIIGVRGDEVDSPVASDFETLISEKNSHIKIECPKFPYRWDKDKISAYTDGFYLDAEEIEKVVWNDDDTILFYMHNRKTVFPQIVSLEPQVRLEA